MNPNVKLMFGGSDCNYDHWWSKFMRNESSIFAELMAPTRLGLHKLHWSHVWREIEASSKYDFSLFVEIYSIFHYLMTFLTYRFFYTL